MRDWADNKLYRRDGITISSFQLAIAFSVLLHLAVLWQWKIQKPLPDLTPPSITVKLEPIPGPPPAIVVPPPPQHRAAPPTPPVARAPATPAPRAPATPPAPPVIATAPPVAGETAPPPAPPMRAPPAEDFAAFVEARRRARGEPSAATPAPAEDENARATRLAVANLSTAKAQGVGYDPNRSGGIFTMKSRGVDYAEFMFNGWHTDARRNLQQLVEVRKGGNENIELAVVRKMIEIIRANVQGDFQWRSHRMNKVVTLSARQQDNAGLEEFLMREFFYNPRIAP